jgi:hypothetical protein
MRRSGRGLNLFAGLLWGRRQNSGGLRPVQHRIAVSVERKEAAGLGSELYREPNPARGFGAFEQWVEALFCAESFVALTIRGDKVAMMGRALNTAHFRSTYSNHCLNRRCSGP